MLNRLIVTRAALVALALNFASAAASAQTGAPTTAVNIVFAVLTKSVEAKSAVTGQELTLRTISDVAVDGEVVIPRDSRLLGHITEVKVRSEGASQTVLSVVIEKAVTKDGGEVPVQAIIAAVAAPRDKNPTPDPTYGMLHSAEPKMVGTTPGRAAGAGELPAGSRAGKSAEAAAAEMQGAAREPLLLEADSQGAIGYEGLSLSWRLAEPPPVTVFSTKGKNVKLDAGAQMLLRMAPPRSGRRRL